MDSSYPPPSKPFAVAHALNTDVFSHNGIPTLRYWLKHGWYRYNGRSWSPADELEVKGPIWERLEQTQFETDKGMVDFSPTPAKVANTIEPLQWLNRLDGEIEPPVWLHNIGGDNPKSLIVLENGVLNFRTGNFTKGHTPALFTVWHLPFAYNPNATCPQWKAFLNQTFAHDPDAARALQQWAGYLISGRTDLHKALMLIGPPRSGKGTISRVLQQLVGTQNSVSPSFGTLGSNFGAQVLIGKTFAVFEDSRNDRDRNIGQTVERIIGITGGDAQTIDRKYHEAWNGQLNTRFMLVSNEIPRLTDASGALVNRFVSIELKRSHADNPDPELGAKLAAELPGIFIWALEGLRDLEAAGTFTTPQTMAGLTEMLADISQPVATFLDDHENYTLTGNPEDHVLLRDIHGDYKTWCEEVGVGAVKQSSFAQALKATDPRIEHKNTAVDGHPKARRIFGVKRTDNPHAWQISQRTA